MEASARTMSLRQSSPTFAFDRRPPSPVTAASIFFNLVTSSRIRAIGSGAGFGGLAGGIGGGGGGGGGVRQDLYQPFRPPLPEIAAGGGTTVEQDLAVLRDRQGVWYEYAAVIPRLAAAGYTPSQLDEATGVTGVEQNQLVVAAQVRGTLVAGGMAPVALSSFDVPDGASILYEIRVLSATQRLSAANFVLERSMDARGARELARAIKDFDRRRRELYWDRFSSSLPGDCLAFWWYRQSKEFSSGHDKDSAFQKAMEFATSDMARDLLASLSGTLAETPASSPEVQRTSTATTVAAMVSVVRLDMGETSGLLVVPVAEADERSISEAPITSEEGSFRIRKSSKAWKGAWVPLPGWNPILEARSPLAVTFPNRAILQKKSSKNREEMLLVIDRAAVDDGDVKSQSAYLVAMQPSGELCLRTGGELKLASDSLTTLGEVVLALSPSEGGFD